MFDEFLDEAGALRTAECSFVVAVVVRCEPPVSGKPGDKAIIRADGSIWGWIGGGCVEPLVIREALKALEDGSPRLVRIAPTLDSMSEKAVVNYTMKCHGGGALDIYIEPVLAKPQILILGRSSVAKTLSRLGKAIGYGVTVIASGANREIFPEADSVGEDFDSLGAKIGSETYVVVSTQGEDDEKALEQTLRGNPRYVSFVVSRAKARKVFELLAEKGISRDLLARVKAPAGLDIGSITPEEIAVSILGEIIQVKNSKATQPEKAGMGAPTITSSKDPVCGMMVDESEAKYFSEYRGKTYYFCCAGCKQAFEKQPEAYRDSQVQITPIGTEH
jgi:xanthine dehydrogenase accessory factor